MPKYTFHFLNVKNGDCSIIEHGSGHVSVIDICNARKTTEEILVDESSMFSKSISGNFQQKKHPVNPIEYLKKFRINSIFRFILTHPDMDHMDGIKDFFEEFLPTNFWDTGNKVEKDFENRSPYREEDWKFYKKIRDDDSQQQSPKRITLFSGSQGQYWSQNTDGESPGDAISILSPTPELVKEANETGNYNDLSYVVLYRGAGGKILISGDSHDKTWKHILENCENDVKNVDLLIAPHHGRDSKRSCDFLDTVNPKMTFFGNAKSEHLAYSAWYNRNLEFVTNNQANCMVVDCSGDNLVLYVTNKKFAKAKNPRSFYEQLYDAWYIKEIVS